MAHCCNYSFNRILIMIYEEGSKIYRFFKWVKTRQQSMEFAYQRYFGVAPVAQIRNLTKLVATRILVQMDFSILKIYT